MNASFPNYVKETQSILSRLKQAKKPKLKRENKFEGKKGLDLENTHRASPDL
jgi:hypothetical protein